MKTMAIAAAAAMLSLGTAYAGANIPPPPADTNGNTCLPTYQIVRTQVAPDERSITFHMKNGATWVNTLPAQCRGLNLHGFTYTSRTINEVCARQGIRQVQTGTVCMLGEFAPGPGKPSQQY